MIMKKRKYTRPDVKISEWDFNESVCVMVNSVESCIDVENGSTTNTVEVRDQVEGEWGWANSNRTGSR